MKAILASQMKGTFNKIKPIDLIAYVAVVIAVIFAMSFLVRNISEGDDSYEIRVMDFRQSKDKQFRSGEDSPIEEKEQFNGLAYYYPNPRFRVEAKLEMLSDSLLTDIERNNGRIDQFLKIARATFKLQGKEHTVLLLGKKKQEEQNYLFLPFTDLTSGKTTYGGGRYIDIELTDENKVIIDFNLAYNPFCVYNYRYSCPIPPKENFIDTEIKAGEKMYQE